MGSLGLVCFHLFLRLLQDSFSFDVLCHSRHVAMLMLALFLQAQVLVSDKSSRALSVNTCPIVQ